MATVNKVTINDRSIDKASRVKNFNDAVSEYIWNAFDAKATRVDINYTLNSVTGIEDLSIKDNGTGIDYDNLKNTFGILLDSQKKSLAGSNVHGNKGNGRFAFREFSGQVVWTSIYKKNEKIYRFTIAIKGDDKDIYEVTDPIEINDAEIKTGCNATFYSLNNDKVSQIITNSFTDNLKNEFGWLLYLREKQNLGIYINDKPIDYRSIIFKSDKTVITVESEKQSVKFDITYIEWKWSIGDKYYYHYFLDDDYFEKGKQTTSFNKNGIDFHHSIYVVSDYFKKYLPASEMETNQGLLFEDDVIFRKLKVELHNYLEKKQRDFIDRSANLLIAKLEKEGVFPQFEKNDIGLERKDEFAKVTKTIFKLQPKLFIKVDALQKKSFLGLLQLLIDSDERENILKIMDSIVNDMTKDERAELVQLLESTKINKIVRTVRQVAGRLKNIETLKLLVREYEKYTNERDHIQKVMEECFWLFGEQYSLVSADKRFEVSLRNYYLDILNKSIPDDKKLKIDHEDKDRRPDLFLCRQRPVTTSSSSFYEENIIVELKRPGVDIGVNQYRQIEDYMNLIISNPEFNGETRIWKFYIVGNNISDEITRKLQQRQEEGRELFLADEVGKYRIYVIKWDDLFQTFKLKNDFLFTNLDINKEALLSELKDAEISETAMPDFLIKSISK